MRRVVLRGIATRRLRTILSAFAVILGVALVTGAMTLGGALDDGANKLAASAYDGTDAVVSAPSAFRGQDLTRRATIPAATLDRVARVPGVAVAAADVLDEAKVIGTDGKPVGQGPYFGTGFDPRERAAAQTNPMKLVDGRWAVGPDQVVIDRGLASDQGLHVGSRVRVAADGPVRSYVVSGVARFGTVDSLGMATVVVFDLPVAQKLFGKAGRLDDVLVAAAPGVSGAELRARLARALGPESGLAVRTARAQDRFTIVSGLQGFVGFLKTALVVFGLIAVLVGAMTIANALSLTVAQRARELALLRAVGASRRQVLRSVVLEALVIGLLGSALGIALGVGLAHGLHALVKSFGLDLPSSSLALTAGTVIAATLTGVGATLLSSLIPAFKATHVPPVAALREGAAAATASARGRRRATIIGGGFGAVGVAIIVYAMVAGSLAVGDRLLLFVPGGLALLVGVAMLARYAVVPIASVLGAPSARVAGVAGGLARRNAMRAPQRTAATAAALMVGVALVTCVAVLAAGLKSSARDDVRDQVRASVVIAGQDNWTPVPQAVVRAAASAPGAKIATGVVVDEGRAYGKAVHVTGVDPAAAAKLWHVDWHRGSDATLRGLNGDGAIVRRDFADKHGLRVGSAFVVTSANGRQLRARVAGIATGSPLDVLGTGEVMVARAAFASTFAVRKPKLVLVDGASADAVRRAVAAFPDAKVSTRGAFADAKAKELDGVVGIVTVLLALALIISVLGIVNTLALGVAERTRELGVLRAVGMRRRQMRRMVRHEGALTALIGATLGIGVGLALAGAISAALASQGVRFVIPFGSIAAYAIVAAVAGILAAALPARRAARLPILGALAHE
ncbi:ABC transporter permease [Baekduia sp. Peel2402]|uniref:ABC transporter permease n=1 Tax=Baekduia sp. Peel2402 TaxID=3458296 RepID=UPI00403E6D01